MKTSRHTLGTSLVFAGTAIVFLVLDVYGVAQGGMDWSVLPAVLAQVLAITIVVGCWIYAMTYVENGVAKERAAPAPAVGADEDLLVERTVEVYVRGVVLSRGGAGSHA